MSSMFAEQNRTDLRDRAAETLVVIPIGATEQHGPHLPCGADWFLVDHIAREAAARAAGRIQVLVAPALPFGSSDHHLPFGATLSLGAETYYRVLRDLLASLRRSGFTRAFLLNGHGGNTELAQLAARDAALESEMTVAASSYWTIAWDALVAAGAHLDCRLPGHAGAFETSLMLAARPDLAHGPRPHRPGAFQTGAEGRAPAFRVERPGFWQSIDGYSDSPDAASGERGRRDLAVIVEAVAQALVAFAAPDPTGTA